jgi:hypothetical protein
LNQLQSKTKSDFRRAINIEEPYISNKQNKVGDGTRQRYFSPHDNSHKNINGTTTATGHAAATDYYNI